ncbi:MAG: hypothetical protein ACC645_09250 [Pirellulales bacterium]
MMINGQDGLDRVHFFDDANSLQANLAFTQNAFAELFPASDPLDADGIDDDFLAFYTDIFNEDPRGDYASVVLTHTDTSNNSEINTPLNVNAHATEEVVATLGAGDDVIQLTSDQYPYDITVYAGAGQDTFNVENAVDLLGNQAVFNGQDDDDLFFADFEAGVPTTNLDIVFNGGGQGSEGDKFRIAGDEQTSGGTYTPSSILARAGSLDLAGNQFEFTGVEPVVVHGLPDFSVVTTDHPADLAIESIAVNDLQLTNLSLQLVTIDGVVSWTQEFELTHRRRLGTGVSWQRRNLQGS